MKQLIIILLGLFGVAYGQSSPTSAKTRFVNGLYVGTKLDSYFAAADSNAIYWRADSALMAKYKGTARRVLFVSDSATYFDQVVRTFGTQTVGGNKTFSNDIVVSGAYLGRRNARNIIFGGSSLGLNTTGLANTAIGDTTLFNNTSGNENTAIGYFSMRDNTTGAFNTAIGSQSLLGNTTGETNIGLGGRTLLYNTTGSRNIGIGYGAGEVSVSGTNTTPNKSIYIGYLTRPSAANQTNQIVIGDSAIGNGSNTVTIGNSSVTDNYFTGNIRGGAFIKSGGTSSQFLKADGSVDSTAYATAASLSGYLPLSGGTLTGSLNGTSLSMSGSADFGSSIRSTGAVGYASGSGVEIRNNGGVGEIFGYNRTTPAYLPMKLNGLTLKINDETSGVTLISGATDDGTNKLIVNGGVKGNRYYATGTGFASATSAEIALQNTTATTGRTFVLNSLNSGGFQIFDATASNTTRFLIDSTGAITASSSVTASSFIRSGGTSTQAQMADGSVQTLTSGTYTATLTNIANLTSSTQNGSFKYTRVGDIVTVSGNINLNITSNNTLTQLAISLPIASNFGGATDANGIFTVYGAGQASNVGRIIGDATNDRVQVDVYTALYSGSQTSYFQFTYKIF